jgi:Ni,Fe-hydrogenase maturation factor
VKLYVFGNEYLEQDSLARKVASCLEDIELVHSRSPDDLLEAEGEMIILDVAKGITEPRLITDTSKLKAANIVSMHDFDLGYFLRLLDELGTPKKVKIIALPQNGDPLALSKQVQQWITPQKALA